MFKTPHFNVFFNSCTCIALVTLSALKHFNARSFWNESRSVFHGSGNGSLWGLEIKHSTKYD